MCKCLINKTSDFRLFVLSFTNRLCMIWVVKCFLICLVAQYLISFTNALCVSKRNVHSIVCHLAHWPLRQVCSFCHWNLLCFFQFFPVLSITVESGWNFHKHMHFFHSPCDSINTAFLQSRVIYLFKIILYYSWNNYLWRCLF